MPYVIGGDTAGEGSDSFVTQVLDNRTGEQVAVLRGKFDEDVFARQVYCLGRHYNTALIGIETNFSTYGDGAGAAGVSEAVHPGEHRRLYAQDQAELWLSHQHEDEAGHHCGAHQAVRDDITIVNDETTLQEMLTFVRNPETLKPEAELGAHDDCVLSLAIAHYIRPQQSYIAQKETVARLWTASMWEDYENASPMEREMLRKRWGNPQR